MKRACVLTTLMLVLAGCAEKSEEQKVTDAVKRTDDHPAVREDMKIKSIRCSPSRRDDAWGCSLTTRSGHTFRCSADTATDRITVFCLLSGERAFL